MSFCDIQNKQGRGRGYKPKPKTEAVNRYLDLDYSGYHKKPNVKIVLLDIEWNVVFFFASSLPANKTKRASLTWWP